MKQSTNFLPYAAATLCGLIVFFTITLTTGKNEAWDHDIYFSVGIPFMCIVVFAIAYLFPRKPWRWALCMAGGQMLAAVINGSSLSLLPIAVIFMAVISIPQFLAAFVGSKLSRKKASQ